MQPILKDMSSYVRDTKDFLTKLNHVRCLPKQSLLVTLNVTSLNTNIPNNKGIKSVRGVYEEYPYKAVSAKVRITSSGLIFTLNNFIFTTLNIYKLWHVQWAQFALQHTLIFLWYNLNENRYTYTFKEKLYYF